MDVREQDVAFPVADGGPVTGKDKVAASEVSEATHDSEAFLEIALIHVRGGAPSVITGDCRERCDSFFRLDEPLGRRRASLPKLSFPTVAYLRVLKGFSDLLREFR